MYGCFQNLAEDFSIFCLSLGRIFKNPFTLFSCSVYRFLFTQFQGRVIMAIALASQMAV